MMEDEKSKIRRNLVVFCAVYLGCAYLEIPIQLVANYALFSKVGFDVSAQKWLVVSTVVCCYLAFRWFSSDEQRGQFGEFKSEFVKTLDSLFFDWVTRAVQRGGFGHWLQIASDEDKAVFEKWTADGKKQYGEFSVVSKVSSYSKASIFSGFVSLSAHMEARGREASTVLSFSVRAVLPPFARIRHLWSATVYVAGRAAFWEWMPPFLLFLCTIGFLAVKWVR